MESKQGHPNIASPRLYRVVLPTVRALDRETSSRGLAKENTRVPGERAKHKVDTCPTLV